MVVFGRAVQRLLGVQQRHAQKGKEEKSPAIRMRGSPDMMQTTSG